MKLPFKHYIEHCWRNCLLMFKTKFDQLLHLFFFLRQWKNYKNLFLPSPFKAFLITFLKCHYSSPLKWFWFERKHSQFKKNTLLSAGILKVFSPLWLNYFSYFPHIFLSWAPGTWIGKVVSAHTQPTTIGLVIMNDNQPNFFTQKSQLLLGLYFRV